METKTKIIVSRSSEWMNRLRTYKVLINGNQVGMVKNGGTEEFSVQPGNNSVQCKVDWYSSKPFSIDIKEGETAYLRVRSGMKLYWPFFIAIIVGVFLVFYYKGRPERPEWLTPVTLVLLIPGVLYSLYYTTFGRKNYLVIQKDSKNIFA
ncbi:MAG TPA: hypothetical protein VG676_15190 [Chitinophagaceae bacterium]|jgi:hypothetical protein|nr:hypothetical protein [Chitinophagaceae bacterium]